MHLSLILLVFFSILLIILMVTCFICFIRTRRKEDEEFMQQVQFQAARQHDFQSRQFVVAQKQQQQQQQSVLLQSPSDSMTSEQQAAAARAYAQANAGHKTAPALQNSNISGQANPYYSPTTLVQAQQSPYANQAHQQQQHQQRVPTETRSDITQQINAAIIGSSEAEFQNDFIQVFPMYQIAPQPEKNTTPYLT